MIDETFHLTPLDARRYEFGKAIRGYDPERVNQFRDQVAEELERLARVNQDLDAKARGFHEQLRAFRERDKAINEALVSAQQLRTEIREQAEKEGQLIIREARAEAERLLDEARSEVRRIEDQLVSLDRARRAYLAQLRVLIERQLTELTAAEQAPVSIPAKRDGASAPPAQAPEPAAARVTQPSVRPAEAPARPSEAPARPTEPPARVPALEKK
jgi:DivIVA domain-containing protein